MRTSQAAPGVPLGQYEDRVDVLVYCQACPWWEKYPRKEIIARLIRREVGGPQTGIKALAGLLTRPCPRCGGRKFETRPAYPSVPGQDGITRRET